MRYLCACVAMSLCVAGTMRAEDTAQRDDDAATKKSVQFDGETLILAFQDGNGDSTLEEYLLDGEKLDSWTKLAAIYTYANLNDPKEVATELARKLDQRDPPAPNEIEANKETGDVFVEFIVWPDGFSKPEDAPYVEFNVFKYAKRDGGGLIAHQFALREYDDIKGFLAKLGPIKERLIASMKSEGLRTSSADSASEEQPVANASDEPQSSDTE